MKKLLIISLLIGLLTSSAVYYVHLTAPRISDIPKMKGTVLVEVYEEKCPWYQKANKEVAELLKWHKDIKLVKVEGTKEQAFRHLYKANASPTWLVFKDGRIVGRAMGYMSAKKLFEKIEHPNMEEPKPRPPIQNPYLKIKELEDRIKKLEDDRGKNQ